ncbi:putative phage abortive infection protein [uncultured Flavobacterium sp.]|uniref:putative phage abortive infection protein n=1 Tax=uncultured Flavobacterium sp. TaxID=165435 RepID=UPI0030C7EF84
MENTYYHYFFAVITCYGLYVLNYYIENPYYDENENLQYLGSLGDLVGGLLNPIIAIPATILTFLAFWVQFKANEQQKTDLKIERFENKFYEMLQIHRDNVNEVTIGSSLVGRKSFISMFNELKFTYHLVNSYYENFYKTLNLQENIDDEVIYNVSYFIFFFGVGKNSSLIVKDLLGDQYEGFFNSVEEYVKLYQLLWRNQSRIGRPIDVIIDLNSNYTLDIRYMPCNGQMSKLSHYVRHLFQMVKFVDDADKDIFDYESKYNYIASIRSQLSAHEQLLLFYNSVSVLGKPWLDTPNYLKKYCVIKSCPLPLANFYKKPLEILGEKNDNGKIMFEWGEIKQRLNS